MARSWRESNRIRGYGDFLHYHLLAAGKIDAVIETDVNILDIAACAAIVNEAGGRFTDLSGAPDHLAVDLGAGDQRALHAPLLAALARPKSWSQRVKPGRTAAGR